MCTSFCAHLGTCHVWDLSIKYPAMNYEKGRRLLKKIQGTLYIGQWHLSPLQSRKLGTSYSSPNCHQLPYCIVLDLINGLKYLPFQNHLWKVLGKARSHRAPNPGFREAEPPGWFDILQKISAWDVMYEQAHCQDEAANHQLPTAVVFWIIQTGSAEECSSLMHNLMQICCSTCLVILNVMATQYTCSLNSICPHGLEQWSCYCSHIHILVHSPWPPGYSDVDKPFSIY